MTGSGLASKPELTPIAGQAGRPRWWPGDRVILKDGTRRVRDRDGSWYPAGLDGTSRYPVVMTDSQVSAALEDHFGSDAAQRWEALAKERGVALTNLRREMAAAIRAAGVHALTGTHGFADLDAAAGLLLGILLAGAAVEGPAAEYPPSPASMGMDLRLSAYLQARGIQILADSLGRQVEYLDGEVHELADAVEAGDRVGTCKEIGDTQHALLATAREAGTTVEECMAIALEADRGRGYTPSAEWKRRTGARTESPAALPQSTN